MTDEYTTYACDDFGTVCIGNEYGIIAVVNPGREDAAREIVFRINDAERRCACLSRRVDEVMAENQTMVEALYRAIAGDYESAVKMLEAINDG